MSGPVRRSALSLQGVTKAYLEGTPVLAGVDLVVPRGTVTALVGANGSGKSTLVKILSGYHAADAGSRVEVGGRELKSGTPEEARGAGLRFVHQESTLVPGISVLDNMLLGGYSTRFGRISWKEGRRAVARLLSEGRVDVELDTDVGALSLAEQAKLAMLRALRTAPEEPINALILDEPTAALGREDSAEVLQWARSLAAERDLGVVLISHRLDEVLAVADDVAVLRGGRIVAHEPAASLSHERLVEHMVGRQPDQFYPQRADALAGSRAMVVEDLHAPGLHGIGFELARGEILGISGLPGSGMEVVARALVDPAVARSGTIEIGGRRLDAARAAVGDRMRAGIGLVPAERRRLAVADHLSISDNLSLPRIAKFVRRGLLRRSAEHGDATQRLEDHGVVASSARMPIGRLSGGNQQKAVLAKWFALRPDVLVVHEPTQAVDVGAKPAIFRMLADLAADGAAVVVVSVEYEDLAHLCDRLLVLGDGRVVAELSGAELTADSVTSAVLLSAQQRTA